MDSINISDWRSSLRNWRRRKGIAQKTLAAKTGLSHATIRALESGSRNPSREALTRIVRQLGIPRQEANLIFASAGYTIDWSTLLEGRYVFDEDHARTQLEQCPWPAFLSDQAINVVATNHLLELIFDVDLTRQYLGPTDRNLLGGASDPNLARYLENYDEVVSFMIGLAKGDPRTQQNMERPSPWLEEPMARFLQGDPQLITRVMGLWESAPAISHRTRHQFEVRWLYRGETPMRFLGVLTVGDLWNELSWNDWIPADSETWSTLRAISASD
jgi:transcriptional regulator with XRE-family HTH domain